MNYVCEFWLVKCTVMDLCVCARARARARARACVYV